MTFSIALVLFLIILAIVLFATEKISVDLITLSLLIVLVMVGILTPTQAFSGFSSEIIIILGSIFIMGGALQETGVLDMLGNRLVKLASGSDSKLVFILMSVAGSVSAFMNNTTVTAILTPPVMVMGRRAKISPSKLLMPMAHASILGGTCTLIGTSTNVAVSGYMKKVGLEPLSMFEITPIGLVILFVGVAYTMLIGRRFLPDHPPEDLTGNYAIREYLSEIVVMPNSPLIGQMSFDSDLNVLDFRILKIIRGEESFLPTSRVIIEEGDTLLVEGRVENLMKVKKIEGIEIKADIKLGDRDLESSHFRMAEVLLMPQSELAGRTLKEANFRRHYGLTALAIYRHGQTLREEVGDIVLRTGDLLLVQGPDDRIEAVRSHPGLSILDEVKQPNYDPKRGLFAITLFVSAVVLASIDVLPVSIAFLGSAILAILLRCVSIERAYEFIDWRLLILIGGMTAFGTAMEVTGAARYLAETIIHGLGPYGPFAILTGFFLLTVALTQPMSNAAAALVVLPVAIQTAAQLGVSERTFAIAVMLAGSSSFITPFEPACILVYGPGKYKFRDYLKVGCGLTLVLTCVVLPLIPVFWPLQPH
jgi:di/tricarboxylate transporter